MEGINKENLNLTYWNISISLINKYLKNIIKLRHTIQTDDKNTVDTSNNGIPIISVGCGEGTLESFLNQKYKIDNFVLVDPEPNSKPSANLENVKPFLDRNKNLKINYNTVQDLLADEKQKEIVVGRCILLLPWAFPNESVYDIEAVRLLKPTDIVIIYESRGAALGATFHHWLSKINGNARCQRYINEDNIDIQQINDFMLQNYELHRQYSYGITVHHPILGDDPNNYTLAWVKQSSLSGDTDIENTTEGEPVDDDHVSCSVQ